MNNFVLEKFEEREICTFYTVRWEDSEFSETEIFFRNFYQNEKYKTNVQELVSFIFNKIGNEVGAQKSFFRFENRAGALPPSGEFIVNDLKLNFVEFPLRIYCLRLSTNLVILFNGGEKTASSAQDGATAYAFHSSNTFVKRINEALTNRYILISDDNRNILSFDGTTDILL